MAAMGTFITTFPTSVTSCNIISWSSDNRLAIATDDGVFLLDLLVSPNHSDAVCHFSHAKIPPSCEDAVIFVPFNFRSVSKTIANTELHEMMLDRTLCPRNDMQVSSKGFKSAVWSPHGADSAGRCILATLSHDHQLCIYTSGNSLNTWHMVADLSSMYASEHPPSGDTSYSVLKEETYKLAAVEVSWSSAYEHADSKDGRRSRYGFLAVGMKNGDVVLWRIALPCLDKSHCSIVKVISLDTSIPTSLSWCPRQAKQDKAVLAVGYSTGVMHLLDIDVGTEVKVTSKCIFSDVDHLRVSCMCWTKLASGSHLLISSKEQHLMTHKVKVDNKLTVAQKATITGKHWMMGTGLSSCDRLMMFCSADGLVQQITVTELPGKSQEIVLDLNVMELHNDDKYTWTCQGVSVSPNGSFFAAMSFPTSTFCHLEVREPLKLEVLQIGDTEIIHELTGPLSRAGDVYEAYRQGICCEVDFLDVLKEHRLNVTDLEDQPLKALKIYRFFFLILDNMLKKSLEEEKEDFVPLSKDTARFTEEIQSRLIKQRFVDIAKRKEKLTPLEKKSLLQMYQWLEESQTEAHRNFSKSEVVAMVIGQIKDDLPSPCTICQENLQRESSLYKCPNGHTFGACCLTLLPTDEVPYRKCQICGVLALGMDKIKDFTWLGADLVRCCLCEGLLV